MNRIVLILLVAMMMTFIGGNAANAKDDVKKAEGNQCENYKDI